MTNSAINLMDSHLIEEDLHLNLLDLPENGERWEAAVAESIAFEAQRDTRRVLYGIMRELKKRNDKIENAAAYLKIVQDEFDLIVEREKGPRAFLEGQAKRLAKELAGDSKHHDITGYARIQFRHAEPRAFIEDPAAVVQWLKDHEREDLIRVKEEPQATEVNKLVEVSGELIPGTNIAPASDTANIQWGKA